MLFTFTLPCIVLEQAYGSPDSARFGNLNHDNHARLRRLARPHLENRRQYQKPNSDSNCLTEKSATLVCHKSLRQIWNPKTSVETMSPGSELAFVLQSLGSSVGHLAAFLHFQSPNFSRLSLKGKINVQKCTYLWDQECTRAFSLFNIKMVHIILRQSNAIIKRQIRTLEF